MERRDSCQRATFGSPMQYRSLNDRYDDPVLAELPAQVDVAEAHR